MTVLVVSAMTDVLICACAADATDASAMSDIICKVRFVIMEKILDVVYILSETYCRPNGP